MATRRHQGDLEERQAAAARGNPCRIVGCDRPIGVIWIGLCRKHYESRSRRPTAAARSVSMAIPRTFKGLRDSQYGIGFHQDVLISAGGGRVWYVAKGSQLQRSVERIIGDALQPFDREHPIWHLAPFIDFPGTYGDTTYHFEWEREWRVPGNFEFVPEEVAFLFIPDEMHSAARWFFEEAEREHTGPSYDCPFLDPLWDDDLIQGALEGL